MNMQMRNSLIHQFIKLSEAESVKDTLFNKYTHLNIKVIKLADCCGVLTVILFN